MLFTAMIILVGAAVMVPEQLPKASRILGRFTGRSVRFLFQTKQALSQSKDSELIKMKKDLDELMGEFYSVRSDIRQGFNIRRVPTSSSVSTTTTAASSADQVSTDSAASDLSAQEEIYSQLPDTSDRVQKDHNNRSSSNFAQAFAAVQSTYVPPTTVHAQQQQQQQQNTPVSGIDVEKVVQEIRQQQTTAEVDLKKNPFANVNFSTQAIRGLQDDSSTHIRTESLGGGADFISKSILERTFAEYAKGNNLNEQQAMVHLMSKKNKQKE